MEVLGTEPRTSCMLSTALYPWAVPSTTRNHFCPQSPVNTWEVRWHTLCRHTFFLPSLISSVLTGWVREHHHNLVSDVHLNRFPITKFLPTSLVLRRISFLTLLSNYNFVWETERHAVSTTFGKGCQWEEWRCGSCHPPPVSWNINFYDYSSNWLWNFLCWVICHLKALLGTLGSVRSPGSGSLRPLLLHPSPRVSAQPSHSVRESPSSPLVQVHSTGVSPTPSTMCLLRWSQFLRGYLLLWLCDLDPGPRTPQRRNCLFCPHLIPVSSQVPHMKEVLRVQKRLLSFQKLISFRLRWTLKIVETKANDLILFQRQKESMSPTLSEGQIKDLEFCSNSLLILPFLLKIYHWTISMGRTPI